MSPLKSKTRRVVFNALLDAAVTGFFLTLVAGIFLVSVREWLMLIARKKVAELRESPPTWLPDFAVAESKPLHAASLIALSLALLREISGESKVDRIQQQCSCTEHSREQAYVRASEERFNGINRCC
jgi:hypothetical protein